MIRGVPAAASLTEEAAQASIAKEKEDEAGKVGSSYWLFERGGEESTVRRIILMVALSAALLTLVAIAASYTVFLPDGKTLFIKQGCVRCHIYRGIGQGKIDLSRVARKWSAERIRDQIRNPRINNPTTGMPNFGHLSNRQVYALIRFLQGKD